MKIKQSDELRFLHWLIKNRQPMISVYFKDFKKAMKQEDEDWNAF